MILTRSDAPAERRNTMTPKQTVIAKHPGAEAVKNAAGGYDVVCGGRILGRGYGAGAAWRSALMGWSLKPVA